MPLSVLISHSHAERELADAWKELLRRISQGVVDPWFSSDTSPEGGMEIAQEWRETLRERIKDSVIVLAILSPTSCDRPWVLWECGVMNGLAQGRAPDGDGALPGAVVPILYSMSRSDLQNPLSSFQLYVGDERANVSELCERLAKKAGLTHPQPDLWAPVLDKYMAKVAAYRPSRPEASRARTPEDMLLWRDRFEQMIQAGRSKEVHGLRQQMYAGFGANFEPVSMQLHDLLSKVMLETRHYKEAIEEADFGLRINSSDVALLHRKALALAEMQNLQSALETVSSLLKRAPALETNPEIAGLLGRIHRDRYRTSGDPRDLAAARAAYGRGAEANPSDYFCAVNAAALALAAGDRPGAEPFFDQALRNAQDAQREPIASYWADFTVGEILLGKGETKAALQEYLKGLKRKPAPQELQRGSALKGALRMAELTGAPAEVRKRLSQLLAPAGLRRRRRGV